MLSSPKSFAGAPDYAACRELIRTGSRSFYAASLLLPDDLRTAAYALYAFCRVSDDAVDASRDPAAALQRMRARLDDIYAGAPRGAVDRRLADVVRAYRLPRPLFDALLEGLAWDVEGRRYETLDALYAYAARVAGAVGAMMAGLMRVRAPAVIARACDLGLAMQLTNIARDVGEDAAMGRLYLPRAWMWEAGLDPDAWLTRPSFSPALASVIARLLDAADKLYARADLGIAALPPRVRPGMRAARLIYAEIGAELARRGYDSIAARTRVSASRKLSLMAQAYAPFSPILDAAPTPIPETQFLIESLAGAARPDPDESDVGDVAWLFQLFETLERRSAA
ncbi:MAG: phytoene/squalene synthase family protein [Alphaproteobacteria bacterium]|nr:phytoene/squalene synthase family protein [Alphaproteobacteria bacterium]